MKRNSLAAHHILLAAPLLFTLLLLAVRVGQNWGINYASLGLLSDILQTQPSSQRQAVERFQDMLEDVEIPERNPRAQLGLVHALLQSGQIETARSELRNIPPGDLHRIGLIQLGRYMARRGELLQAIQVWSEADAMSILIEQGNELAAQGDTENATTAWYAAFQTIQSTLERNEPLPSSQVYEPVLLDLLYEGLIPQQEYEKAIDVLTFMLAQKPDSSVLHRRLGSVYTSAGEYVLSETVLDKAIALDPSDFRTYTERARLDTIRGDLSAAIELLEVGYALAPTEVQANIAFRISTLFIRLQQGQNAIEWMSRAVELSPAQTEYRLALAELLVTLNRREEATAHFRKILASEPDNQEAARALAELLR